MQSRLSGLAVLAVLAFTWLGDEKVVIWRAVPVEAERSAPAGTIVERRPEGPVVACGDGALLLVEVAAPAALARGAVLV